MGLLLGGSVLTVFELIDLIVFRFANTLFGNKQQSVDAETADVVETAAPATERPVSAVSTISTTQRRIRRIAKYQPATSWSAGGQPALVLQTEHAPTPAGRRS